MAQYDLILQQEDGSSDFQLRIVNLTRGGLITASADANRTPRILAAGAENNVLSVNASGDLVWVAQAGGHTQNTDVGTTSATFYLNTSGVKIKDATGILEVRNNADNAYAVARGATPSGANDLVTKDYADGLFAANDALLFKGTIGTGGTHTIAAFNALTTYNAGWTYRVIEAGTIRGNVCQIGDLVLVMVDRTGSGNLDSDFTVAQTNIDGAVIGPASVTDSYFALFDGTTGKLIKASASAPGTMAYASTADYIAKSTYVAQGDVMYASGTAVPAILTAGTAGQVLKTGGAAANPSWVDTYTTLYVAAPASKTATGTAGQMAWDDSWLYICVATNSWKKAAIAFW